MKRIILTALSQNHNLWYEQFIPFIITLRNTSYVGDIGVINYGLSDEYIETLNRNNILIFSPLNAVTNLALDRHISASHIAKQIKHSVCLSILKINRSFMHVQTTKSVVLFMTAVKQMILLSIQQKKLKVG